MIRVLRWLFNDRALLMLAGSELGIAVDQLFVTGRWGLNVTLHVVLSLVLVVYVFRKGPPC